MTTGVDSILKMLEHNRAMMDMTSGFDSISKLVDMTSGVDSISRLIDSNRKLVQLGSGVDSISRLIDSNRKLVQLGSGVGSISKLVESNGQLLGSVTARSSFMSQFGPTTLAQLSRTPRFSSMVGTAVMPRHDWSHALGGLRTVIGTEMYERAVVDFEVAAELAGESAGETWWVARLPLAAQLFLMLLVLQVLDKAGEFLGDLTGEDVPDAYRTGTEALFYLAFALYAFTEMRAKLLEDEEPRG